MGRIRKYLSLEGLKMLVNVLVISRLDFCNCLLYGIPKYQRDKLQRIQNTAARLVMGVKLSGHATPILKNLHWLPVEKKIEFKILLITYTWPLCRLPEAFNWNASTVTNFKISVTFTTLSSKAKTKNYGCRVFSFVALKLWNSLPEDINNAKTGIFFKNKLKTHLFRKAFFFF